MKRNSSAYIKRVYSYLATATVEAQHQIVLYDVIAALRSLVPYTYIYS